ncbi:hypothetical protein SV7mr_26900 [Stieleria bergensis]|uniref:DUF7832 domain-containing protein n=1 Tax=Stieleria bergensis TaxID=2528025 RepID=A0A517SVR0_9BACT|nr:hypothetical protein SV7mr_26900 [Planctomycetes bacterium SV_7m_r]
MSDVQVYDKAKWHFEGRFPKGLPKSCAFTHGGFLVAWLLRRQFISERCIRDHSDAFDAFNDGKKSAGELYQSLDGVLESEMLTDHARRFASDYIEESYLEDYEMLFEDMFPKVYDVPDNAEHLEMACEMLDTIYSEWLEEDGG